MNRAEMMQEIARLKATNKGLLEKIAEYEREELLRSKMAGSTRRILQKPPERLMTEAQRIANKARKTASTLFRR